MTANYKKSAIVLCLAFLASLGLPATGMAASNGGFGYDQQDLPTIDGSQLQTGIGQLLGHTVTFSGRLTGVTAGQEIEIQRGDGAGNWTKIAAAIADANGRFSTTWTPKKAERFLIRAVPPGAAVRTASTIPTHTVSIYKTATATWFGPGFYGKKTFCGQRLRRSTLGVAHKSLPCGSKVQVFYNGRSIVVPVIDRGPFRRKTDYDLTAAAAKKLNMTHVDKIGALPAS